MDFKILLFIFIMACSVFSAYPPICEDYFEDSGIFISENFGNNYYIMNYSQNSNCMNELFVYFIHNTSTNIKFMERTSNPSIKGVSFGYTSPFEFNFSNIDYNENKTYISPGSFSTSNSAIFTNSSGGIYNISSGTLNMSKISNNILQIKNGGNITFTDNLIFINPNYNTNSFWNSIENSWLYNVSLVGRNQTKPIIIYLSISNTAYNSNYGYRLFKNDVSYNMYITNITNNINTQYYNNISGQNLLIYFNKNNNSNNGSYYYFTSEPANPYKAYLLYGSSLITPQISSYYTNFNGMDPFIIPYRYNQTDLSTILYGNIATIVKDSYGICYFAPPYTPSNYSLTYSISVYQTPCPSESESGYEGIITFPLLPNHINCGTEGTQFISNITYDTDVLFETYITYANASVVYNSSLASSLFSNITLTNETSIIDIKVNNRTRCYWNDETSVLGFELPFNDITNQLIGIPLLIVAVGLSMVNPFVFVFVFVVNDMFSLISIEMIFFLAIATGLMSFVANWNGERNFKVLIILFLLASAYLVQVSTLAPTIAGTELAELTILTEAIETLFSGISTGENLANIIVSILPTFLLNFIILVLKLPAILISIIFASLEAISPLAVAPLRYFEGALIVGAYVFIMLKAYEMGRNMFKSV